MRLKMICSEGAEPSFFLDTTGVVDPCSPLIQFTSKEACPIPTEPLPWYFYI
jgi:metal transporter CNNM